MPPAASPLPGSPGGAPFQPRPDSDPGAFETAAADAEPFRLTQRLPTPVPGKLSFDAQNVNQRAWEGDRQAWGEAAAALFQPSGLPAGDGSAAGSGAATDFGAASSAGTATAIGTAQVEAEQAAVNLNHLGSLRPLAQLRESFILASGEDGLWIIDQHVAHERVLFEKILRDRQVEKVQRQRLLLPLLVELRPAQMVVFARIADELERNGFEVEPFGPQTLAVKAAPVGLEGAALERMLGEVIEQSSANSDEHEQNDDITSLRTRIAASIACHSAIKINTALDPARMEWLLLELAKTRHPTSCPHGRPIALLYSWKEIQRAFHRI
jgi:DNA mismatch repair protein MutL